jgi:hypothetical protein
VQVTNRSDWDCTAIATYIPAGSVCVGYMKHDPSKRRRQFSVGGPEGYNLLPLGFTPRIDLLIRREPGLLARHQFGLVPEELCLNAVEFRTQATPFLLTFKWEVNRKLAKVCVTMLKTSTRYDIQCRFQTNRPSDRGQELICKGLSNFRPSSLERSRACQSPNYPQ